MPFFNPTTALSQYYLWPRNLLFSEEAEGLQKYSKNCKTVVEIGVFEGASACALKKGMHKNGKLFLIDPFIPDSMNQKIKARKIFSKLNVYLTFPFFRDIFWIEEKSTDISWFTPIDFLFIDGDHSEKGTYSDWIKFSPYISKNGYLALHDSIDFSQIDPPAKGHIGPKKLREDLWINDEYKPVDEFGTISLFKKVK
jgi:predicted O-methyltransferase YrrM